MVGFKFYFYFVFKTLVFSAFALCCSSTNEFLAPADDEEELNGSDSADEEILFEKNTIIVEPSDKLTLGYFESLSFTVTVINNEGRPIADEPISVSFDGPAHNGNLSPYEFVTDTMGQGIITLTAPDKALQFDIRFSCPSADDVFVAVDVNPSALGLHISIVYSGLRDISTIEASLFENIPCDEIVTSTETTAIETVEADSSSAAFDFEGLYANKNYSVLAIGYNAEGGKRAQECVDNLTVKSDPPTVQVLDTQLSFSGVFQMETEFTTNDKLDEILTNYQDSFDWFTNNLTSTILDDLADLSPNDAILSEFNYIRETETLDFWLNDSFSDRNVDLPQLVSDASTLTQAQLSQISITSQVVFSAASDNSHDFSHLVLEVGFFEEESTLSFTDAVPTEGIVNVDNDNSDSLIFEEHRLPIPLGSIIQDTFSRNMLAKLIEIIEATETETPSPETLMEGIYQHVDCEQVGIAMGPFLVSIMSFEAIVASCMTTLQRADTDMRLEAENLNISYPNLSIIGRCALSDPGEGEQIMTLEKGSLETNWVATPTNIGPFEASFTATRVE